jgi:hypothetical protein
MFIPDHGSECLPSRTKQIPDPHQRILGVFLTQNIVSKLSEISNIDFLPIPDPGVKKAPDLRSATLKKIHVKDRIAATYESKEKRNIQ